jgi:branched-chain amino acid transport system permease protein
MFTQQVFNSVQLGMLFAFAGVGLTLIFGVLKLADFAYGSTFMLGGYATYEFITKWHMPFVLAAILSVLLLTLVGFILERLLLAPFRNSPDAQLISGLAVYLLIKAASTIWLGSNPETIPTVAHGLVKVGGVIMPYDRLISMGVAMVLIIAVWLFLRATHIGRLTRAVSESRTRARLLGVPVAAFEIGAMGIGSGISALAGSLLGSIFAVQPGFDDYALFTSFVLIVLGGLGSIWGAVIGGIIIGATQVLGGAYISSQYATGFPFVILILILLIRPNGLLGKGGRVA